MTAEVPESICERSICKLEVSFRESNNLRRTRGCMLDPKEKKCLEGNLKYEICWGSWLSGEEEGMG